MGCDRITYHGKVRNYSFNPRTRVGCDALAAVRWRIFLFQSTHPCGVRPANTANAAIQTVSIHAPVWGATSSYDNSIPYDYVSIHAPVWGATSIPVRGNAGGWFQSTHPCGVRLPPVSLCSWCRLFQSTHPCGVRLVLEHQYGFVSRFNPRTRVGCDLFYYPKSTTSQGFNPRTRVGCDIKQKS